MKKLLLTTMCMLGLAACANGSNKENNTKKENTMKTIALTKADFLTKVANYETNPTEWKYLGDKPALIVVNNSFFMVIIRFYSSSVSITMQRYRIFSIKTNFLWKIIVG